MKQQNDKNLSLLSSQLFDLQKNLMKKEKYLSQLICDREKVSSNYTKMKARYYIEIIFETIFEQQRIIRRLLRKSVGENNNNSNSDIRFEDLLRDNSDPEDETDGGGYIKYEQIFYLAYYFALVSSHKLPFFHMKIFT